LPHSSGGATAKCAGDGEAAKCSAVRCNGWMQRLCCAVLWRLLSSFHDEDDVVRPVVVQERVTLLLE
jgi:hypothetical protein